MSGFKILYCISCLFICFYSFNLCPPQAAAQTSPAEPSNNPFAEYIIGVGDVIEVLVWKEPDVSRSLQVRLDGKISLPLVGDIVAAGKTLEQLASSVSEKIQKLITEPAVSVMLVESTSRKYYISGEINQPGEFHIDSPITILQAIARSSGFKEWAKKDRIVVIRRIKGKDIFLPFDYEDFLAGKNPGQNILILPGDTIIVP